LEAIVAIGGVDALESLVKATQDVNEQLRSTAAAHLGVLGPDALEVIMEVYPRFTERATVIGAAIAEMGPQAIDFLIAELNSGDAAAESTAAFALSKFEEPRSVEALSQMALNILAEDNIRSTATYHLGNMAHETARASLWMILSSSAGKVAAYSLGRDMDFADCERMEKWLEDNPDVGFGVRSRIRRVVEDFRRRYPGAQAR
jgi:HEAT repeat protein